MTKDFFKNRTYRIAVTLILCAVIAFGVVLYDCFLAPKESNKSFSAMNTIITSTIYTKNNPEIQQEINDEICALEKSLLSKQIDTSEVGRLNKEKSVTVSKDLADIILKCKEISKESNGVFDVTVSPVSSLWSFGNENQRLPSDGEIKSALKNVDYKTVSVNGNSISIGENQSVDLGAVGKGFACDKVKEILDNCNAKSGVVSVGGSLLIYGNKSFKIGIANPDNNKIAMGSLKLKNTCVSTSGDYEQFFEKDGKRYHHVLDAKTGYPADSYLSSVTVICDSGFMSDALSTACYILGYNESLELLKKYDAQAVFIFKDKTVKCTDGISKQFKIINSEFTVEE